MFCDQTVVWKCNACTMLEDGQTWKNTLLSESILRRLKSRDQRTFIREGLGHTPHTLKERGVQIFSREEQQESERAGDLSRQYHAYLSSVVSPYNTRNLTHPSDLVRAFEGIAHFLVHDAAPGSLFAQGLCWGLPVAHLPYALTWTTMQEPLRLRDPDLGFPSWSWFAWEGGVMAHGKRDAGLTLYRKLAGRYVPMCECTLVDRRLTPASPSALPFVDSQGGKRIRIVAQKSIFDVEGLNMEPSRNAFIFRSMNGSVALYPDQIDRMWAPRRRWNDSRVPDFSSLELVGISEFVADSGDAAWVEALWVVQHNVDSADTDQHGAVYRRGVAVVERKVWNKACLNRGERFTVMLE